MGKVSDILSSNQQVQKLYQCLESGSDSSALSPELRIFIAQQRELHAGAVAKIPAWAEAGCLFTRRALEQCTSAQVAEFKASLFHGCTCIDLSGGMGVDAVALAKSFDKVVSVDPDEDLHTLFHHNMSRLHVQGVQRLHTDAETLLKKLTNPVDLIYLDPDRREKMGDKRLLGYRNYRPDPLALFLAYGSMAAVWLIKLSPLDDIQAVLAQWPGIKHIRILSRHGEVKEMLLELVPGYAGVVDITAHLLDDGSAWQYERSIKSVQMLKELAAPLDYLFEPHPALIKSGWMKYSPHQLRPLNASGTLWTFERKTELPGRWVRLQGVLEQQSLRSLAKILKERGVQAAVVKARDFTPGSEEARKILGLKESDHCAVYLTGNGKRKLFLWGVVERP